VADVSRELSTRETYPPELTLREARDRYLAENRFTMDTYTERWARVALGFGAHIVVPSPRSRGDALRMHDLHHALTGYGTDLAGEAEISAWETSRGLGALSRYVRAIVLLGDTQGFLLCPLRTMRALRAAPGRGSLFGRHHEYEVLLARTLGAVRSELGIPRDGLVATRRLHADAPRS
jgi:hypothetical protein